MYDYAKWGMNDYVQLKEKKCYQKQKTRTRRKGQANLACHKVKRRVVKEKKTCTLFKHAYFVY